MEKKIPYLLLADDDPDDQEALIKAFLLQNPFAEVVTVGDGEELLDHLQNCPPAELPVLILMDYKMPVITAADVLQSLQHQTRFAGIPKFVWSTSDRAEFVNQCMRYGATDYFPKPNTLSELDILIARITRVFSGAAGV